MGCFPASESQAELYVYLRIFPIARAGYKGPVNQQEFEMIDTVLFTSLVIGFISVGGISLTLAAIAAGLIEV
jgi:hypothetical protein